MCSATLSAIAPLVHNLLSIDTAGQWCAIAPGSTSDQVRRYWSGQQQKGDDQQRARNHCVHGHHYRRCDSNQANAQGARLGGSVHAQEHIPKAQYTEPRYSRKACTDE
jgi:hypothetical protein